MSATLRAAAAAGRRPPVIEVGNLQARRDYTDVRDVVRAYWLALEMCRPGEVYNIGTGRAWSIREVLDTLLSLGSLEFEVKPDPARMRPSDVPELRADASKFRAETGWVPGIPFETTLKDTLEYWRARVPRAR
jgi:GDP-4-dehydro-6-deoxy-D-mannose reductase